jgi:hypothetical protein
VMQAPPQRAEYGDLQRVLVVKESERDCLNHYLPELSRVTMHAELRALVQLRVAAFTGYPSLFESDRRIEVGDAGEATPFTRILDLDWMGGCHRADAAVAADTEFRRVRVGSGTVSPHTAQSPI